MQFQNISMAYRSCKYGKSTLMIDNSTFVNNFKAISMLIGNKQHIKIKRQSFDDHHKSK